ncbi:MAG: hypothetical protein FJ387_11030 [Verrucomicrobia bacterium]|nr:hypothetical protein [Verrucomicrobiota bacterium]
MTTAVENVPSGPEREGGAAHASWDTSCGYTRNFLSNRFVYAVVSSRAHGLSVSVNMNPDRQCNYDCVYCEVNRALPLTDTRLEVPVMVRELEHTLELALNARLHDLPGFRSLPAELLQLRHVALSGDGEPTLCPNFCEAVHAIVHLRALGRFPFFKLVLISNATGLDLPLVRLGLQSFTLKDELWLKLDGGTAGYVGRINRPKVALEKVIENLILVGRQRPIVIQSLFPRFAGEEPPADELDQYVRRLQGLKDAGVKVSMVQIYSAMRPTLHPDCGHLPLKSLSRIAHLVRAETGLPAEVF